MPRLVIAALSALALSGCVSVSVEDVSVGDSTLHAIQNAHFKECPANRTQANARSSSDAQGSGTESADLGVVPLASDPTRVVRMRRIIIQPGGIIPWHAHDVNQGMAILLSGEMTEYRNNCLDPIVHRAGDMAREDAATAHGWRNLSDRPAVVLVSHVVRQ
jgi:quercetin dioxygenase-like cupin family protein